MKRSNYVNVIEDADLRVGLLVHSVTGAMDIVGTRLLTWFQSDQPISLLDRSLVERLEQRGYLWNILHGEETKYFSELSDGIHRKRINSTINSFWIIPTYRCNLRCFYCFQEHALHEGTGLGSRDMTPAEAIHLITALDQVGGPGPRVGEGKGRYLTLFGGEPLMESTRETVAAIVAEGRVRGYRIGAVTNGVSLAAFKNLLAPDAIRWVQVTLDGLHVMNDRRRLPMADGGFSKIAEGISLALQKGVQVSVRSNVDKSLTESVCELEAWAEAQGWTAHKNFSWYMTPIETHANAGLNRVTIPVQDLIETVGRLGSGQIKVPYRGKFLRLFDSMTKEGLGDHIETSSCGAHTRMYFFDPHGLIYACAEQVGNPNLAIGKVTLGEVAFDEKKASVWLTRHVGNMPICSQCSTAFFCGGGCANAAQIETGNFFGPRCNGIKEAFQIAGRQYLREVIGNLRASGMSIDEVAMYHLNPDDVLRVGRSAFTDMAGSC